MSKQHHDVLIVGGGLVGSSLAIALDKIGVDVGLIEATPLHTLPSVFDQRNLSFAAATINALTTLGVMAHMHAPIAPIRRIHISRQGDFGRIWLHAKKYGREEFGQVVVAHDFGQALEAQMAQLKHLTRYRPARFIGLGTIDEASRGVRIAIEGEERELSCRLVVAADGSQSEVRNALGIATREYDYQQTLFVTRVRMSRHPDGTAYERLGDHGPTALLPRGDRHYGLVHGAARAVASSVMGLDDNAWLVYLQNAFGWRGGRFVASDPRRAYPLIRVIAEQVVAPRAILIGNAAQTIHPIGAQGFNLGLRDALTLAELLSDGGDDPGHPDLLSCYVRRRATDRERTLAFSDNLARLTSNPSHLVRPVRSLGLLALECSPTLQSFLVGGAMGFRGDVPEMCRS